MSKSLILITGASGCVGQYICAWLLQNSNSDLLLWLRDPQKLTAFSTQNPRIRLIIGDLREATLFKKDLNQVTRVIHTATAWGDPERAKQVNVVAVKEILNLLNPTILEQFIYFSTASILDKNLQPLPEALEYGTEYIQTKAECLRELETHQLAEKIVAVFPTLVFGGRIDGKSSFPSSYLTEGLKEAARWLWLARFFRTESSFHFIHAADIASVCGHLATTPHKRNTENNQGSLRRLVLGQPPITINQSVKTLCLWRGVRITPGLPLCGWLIKALVKVLPIEINAWDRFSIKQRHFTHSPISPPERFGFKSQAGNLEEILHQSGLEKVKQRGRGVRM